MREIEFKKSFDRTFQKLSSQERLKTHEVIEQFLKILEEGKVPVGLGLKKLGEDLWEIRVDLSLRIGFRMKKNLIEFGIVGNHDDIKRYLKNC